MKILSQIWLHENIIYRHDFISCEYFPSMTSTKYFEPNVTKSTPQMFFLGAFNSRNSNSPPPPTKKVLPFSQRYHAKWQVSFSWEQYCHENSVVFIRINATRKNMHKSFQHTTSIQLALCSHENTLYS